MKIVSQDLGYREIAELAHLMSVVAKNGIYDDVAETFKYDFKADEPRVTTETGNILHLINGELRTVYTGSFDDICYGKEE